MFPKIGSKDNLNLVTNPHKFTMCNGLEFLGTSGQNIHDVRLYSKLKDPSSIGIQKLLM
jgi:DNA polymerase II small subunit/DNA polymerase delta subunit B